MQDIYTQNIAKGLAGQLFGANHEIEPMFVESGIVNFGYGVAQGTEEQEALLPSAGKTVDDFRGVARLATTIERLHRSEDNPTYDDETNDTMDVVRRGMILVPATAVVARGEPVFWQIVTSGTNYAGTFRNTADAGNAIDISSVAAWFRGNEAIGGLAVLNLRVLL